MVQIGSVTEKSIAYVSGYVQKKYKEDPKMYDELGLIRPFQLQSQGIGMLWAEDHEKDLNERLLVTISGKKQAVPRYYKKKLDMDLDKFEEKWKD